MTNYEEKKDLVIDNISKTLEQLDTDIRNLSSLEDDSAKNNTLNKWYAEKKALHEIKHILHDIDKYKNYDELELEKTEHYLDSLKDKKKN